MNSKEVTYTYTNPTTGKTHTVKRKWQNRTSNERRDLLNDFIEQNKQHKGTVKELFTQYIEQIKDKAVSQASFYKYYRILKNQNESSPDAETKQNQ